MITFKKFSISGATLASLLFVLSATSCTSTPEVLPEPQIEEIQEPVIFDEEGQLYSEYNTEETEAAQEIKENEDLQQNQEEFPEEEISEELPEEIQEEIELILIDESEGFFITEKEEIIPEDVTEAEPEIEEEAEAEPEQEQIADQQEESQEQNSVFKETNLQEQTLPQVELQTQNNSQLKNEPQPVSPAQTSVNEVNQESSSQTAEAEPQQDPLLSYESEAEEGTEENQDTTTIVDNQLVIPSRSVEMKNLQYLDIIYPGSGWIYLGETDNKNNMRYFGRKISSADTTFTLRSTAEGTTILHFYKNDPLTDSYIDDYLAVTISGTNSSTQRVTAPSYEEAVPEKFPGFAEDSIIQEAEPQPVAPTQGNTNTTQNQPAATANSTASSNTQTGKGTVQQTRQEQEDSQVETVIQNSAAQSSTNQNIPSQDNGTQPSTTTRESSSSASTSAGQVIQENQGLSPSQLLSLAWDSFNQKYFSNALDYLTEFFNIAVDDIDEGLYLQGQILESNSSVRNIKAALEAYETLVKLYPASSRWQSANERIKYINRFYFNRR